MGEVGPKIPLLDYLSSRRIHPAIRRAEAVDGGLTGPFYPQDRNDGETVRARRGFQKERAALREDVAARPDRSFFINGIQNTFEEHWDHSQRLANHLNRPVIGIFNKSNLEMPDDKLQRVAATVGLSLRYLLPGALNVPFDDWARVGTSGAEDLKQCLDDHKGLPNNPALQRAQELIERRPSGRFTGHSQGSLILLGALKRIAGPPSKAELTKALEIDFIGSQVDQAPRGPSYLRFIGSRDAPALAPETLFRLRASKSPLFDENVDYLTDSTYIMEGFDHDAEQYMGMLPHSHGDTVHGTKAEISEKGVLGGPLGYLLRRKLNAAANRLTSIARRMGVMTVEAGKWIASKYRKFQDWYKGKLRGGLSWLGAHTIEPLVTKVSRHLPKAGKILDKTPIIGKPIKEFAAVAAQLSIGHRKRIKSTLLDVASLLGSLSALAGAAALIGMVFLGPASLAFLGTASTTLLAGSAAAKSVAALFESLGVFAGEEQTEAYDILADSAADLIGVRANIAADKLDLGASFVTKNEFASAGEMFEAKNTFDKMASLISKLGEQRAIFTDLSRTGAFAKALTRVNRAYKIIDGIGDILDFVSGAKGAFQGAKRLVGQTLAGGKRLITGTGALLGKTWSFTKRIFKRAKNVASDAMSRYGQALMQGYGYPLVGPTYPYLPPKIDKDVQRSSFRGIGSPTALLSNLRSHSTPFKLTSDQRHTFANSRLGVNLAHVNLFSDHIAAKAASAMGARAFTIGRNIFFGEGQFVPSSRRSWALLAHELKHVEQQSQGRQRGIDSRALESEAEHVEKAFFYGNVNSQAFEEFDLVWELGPERAEPAHDRRMEDIRTLLELELPQFLRATDLEVRLEQLDLQIDINLDTESPREVVVAILQKLGTELQQKQRGADSFTPDLQRSTEDTFEDQVKHDFVAGSAEQLLTAAKVVGGLALLGMGAPVLGGAALLWGGADLLRTKDGFRKLPGKLMDETSEDIDHAVDFSPLSPRSWTLWQRMIAGLTAASLPFGPSQSSFWPTGPLVELNRPAYGPPLPDDWPRKKGKGIRTDVRVDDSKNLADWDFIENEEKISDTGYIIATKKETVDPVTKKPSVTYHRKDNSQLTIANGLDLGPNGKNVVDLKINKALKEKLVKASFTVPKIMSKEQYKDLDERAKRLVLTDSELTELIAAVRGRTEKETTVFYNKKGSTKFSDLPIQARTVIADLSHQYGASGASKLSVYKLIQEGKFADAQKELLTMKDYVKRNRARARLLGEILPETPRGKDASAY